MTIRIEPIPALESNYIWMIHDDHAAVLVDPGCAEVALSALKAHGISLTGILVTHHHADHIAGIPRLLEEYPVPVWGPADERIATLTHPLQEGDTVDLDSPKLTLEVMATPGHTSSHITFFNDTKIFCGDTLFSIGCGRLFEGTPAQMQNALDRIARLAPDALVYCGHEYTEANCAFALSVEPNNPALAQRAQAVAQLRANGQPTLPVTLGDELKTNPFLRTRLPSLIAAARQIDPDCGTTATEVFATLRALKDSR